MPVVEHFENALYQCDEVANIALTHELGGASVHREPSEPFPPDEGILHEFFPVAPSIGCGGGPAFAATGVGFSFDVAITNLSAIDYQDLFMVVDPDTDFLFGNWDGLIQGLHAMRIDSVGVNAPLLSESIAPDGIFQAGETWIFRVEEFLDGPFPGRGPHFGSIGVGGFELALILPGLMWLHWRRRRLH